MNLQAFGAIFRHAGPAHPQRLRRFIRQAHRWLGLLIAVQIVFWVGGGLIMSALRLEAVRGEHRMAPSAPVALEPSVNLMPISAVLQAQDRPATSVTLATLLGRPVYRLEGAAGARLVDALNGQALSPLPEAAARALAVADYSGTGAIAAIEWVDTPALEYRGRDLPLWRVRFADERDTTLYIAPNTGQVVARRNDLWRVFDFVWMLHIMDYEGRDDFNHPLLVTTAAAALLFVTTGLFMLGYSFRARRTP